MGTGCLVNVEVLDSKGNRNSAFEKQSTGETFKRNDNKSPRPLQINQQSFHITKNDTSMKRSIYRSDKRLLISRHRKV